MKPDGLKMKYFVLKPRGNDRYAQASRVAMLAYSDEIKYENPYLSRDLKDWVEREVEALEEDDGES